MNNMKNIKLFEEFINEEEKLTAFQKIGDVRNSMSDLQASISKMNQSEEPDRNKIAIAQLKIQKLNLKMQMLQLDSKIESLK